MPKIFEGAKQALSKSTLEFLTVRLSTADDPKVR
jgi:hypothetical protein